MSNILDSNTRVENLNSNLISFKDCPNKCVDGKIVDPYQHKKIPCPYCAEKREKFAKCDVTDRLSGKTLSEILDLPVSYTGSEFNEDLVIPEFARKNMIPESVDCVLKKLRELITDITIGTIPDHSVMFNLGKKSNEVNFIYPYLIKGYIAGKTLVPLVNAIDICRLRMIYEGSLSSADSDKTYTYKDLLTKDLCVIVIDAGATLTSINAVKGVLQLRAQKNKPTLIFTNSWIKGVKDICCDFDYKSYNLATLFSIEYKNNGKELDEIVSNETVINQTQPTTQSRGFGMSSDSLRSLMTAKNSL